MARDYRTDEIVVQWEPRLCIHTGECVRGAPGVFDREARPWIDLSGAEAVHIAEVIARCPSGALHAERLGGAPQDEPEAVLTVRAVRDGPLYVRGDIEVRDANGALIRRDMRLALCRCGASGNKPFCDNSHLESGFQAG
jgi:uncharacterized Fe-S cluster protein YjdI